MKTLKTLKQLQRKKSQGGWIVGALLALVIIASATVVMYGQYSSSEQSAQYQKNAAYVAQTIASAKAVYGSSGYTGLTTALAVNANVIPDAQKSGFNQWSGAVTMGDNSGTTPRTGYLQWNNVPTADCVNLVTSTQNLARQIAVAGVYPKPLDGSLSASGLNTACSSAAQVNIAWIIGAI